MKSLTAILVALIAIAIGYAADRPTDTAARELLVGKWDFSPPDGSRRSEYKADGTGSQVTIANRGMAIALEFKWEIQDGLLVHTVTKTSDPRQFAVGAKNTWNIVELTATTFTHNPYPPVAGNRPVTTETRVKP